MKDFSCEFDISGLPERSVFGSGFARYGFVFGKGFLMAEFGSVKFGVLSKV